MSCRWSSVKILERAGVWQCSWTLGATNSRWMRTRVVMVLLSSRVVSLLKASMRYSVSSIDLSKPFTDSLTILSTSPNLLRVHQVRNATNLYWIHVTNTIKLPLLLRPTLSLRLLKYLLILLTREVLHGMHLRPTTSLTTLQPHQLLKTSRLTTSTRAQSSRP